MKMNKEAINEITNLLEEVKDVVRLMEEFGINIISDPWIATSFSDKEDILTWKKNDFEKITNIEENDEFYIGGNIITGSQHRYKNKSIIAPKELAEIQGKIFEKYLKNIINEISLKHFDIEFENEYGLTDNCGWENYMIIKATIKKSGLEEIKKEKNYIDIKKMNELDNYKLMKESTELFMQLMYFLEEARGYKETKLKIGDFEYDDWHGDIYCIYDKDGLRFKHIRDYDKKEWETKTLLEQFAFAFDFEETKFNFKFEIINDIYKLLNKKEKDYYGECWFEVHADLW